MKQTNRPLLLGRCLLAGLLTGLIMSVLILVYTAIYRNAADLDTYEIIMPFTIFTAFPLFGLVSGGAYFLFANNLRRGDSMFIVVWILVMLILVLVSAMTGHEVPPGLKGFRGLFVGIVLITGLTSAIGIPYLAHHPTLFLTKDQIRDEE